MNIDKNTPEQTADILIKKYTLLHTKDGICDYVAVKESILSEIDERYKSLCVGEWWDQNQIITLSRVHWINARLIIEKLTLSNKAQEMNDYTVTYNTDPIVYSVVKKFNQRSDVGQRKYGTTLDRKDLTRQEWINHLQEELMDAILYCERLKSEL